MTRIVVLGSGTNVGKTYVSCALVRALRGALTNWDVGGLKPVETGYAGASSDAAMLAEASGHIGPFARPLYAFPDPVSPHLAAARAGGEQIEIQSIVNWVRAWEATGTSHVVPRHALALIETAGAAFSPLTAQLSAFDLAIALDPALWILVAPDALGVLHDLRVTLAMFASRGRTPDFVVLSAARGRDPSTGTNATELKALGIADPIVALEPESTDLEPLLQGVVRHVLKSESDASSRLR